MKKTVLGMTLGTLLSVLAYADTVRFTFRGWSSERRGSAEIAAQITVTNDTYAVSIGHKNPWGYTGDDVLSIREGRLANARTANPDSESTEVSADIVDPRDPAKTVTLTYLSAYADERTYTLTTKVDGKEYRFVMIPDVFAE